MLKNQISLSAPDGLFEGMIFRYFAPTYVLGLARAGPELGLERDMRTNKSLGPVAAGVRGPAFLCGLAGPAFAQYTGRSFKPQSSAEKA